MVYKNCKLSDGLAEHQQNRRDKTYCKIKEAVQLLMDEGREINRTGITKESGLAASTFSKSHVKQFLLEQYGIGAKKPVLPFEKKNDPDNNNYDLLLNLYTKNQSMLDKANKKLRNETKLRNSAEEQIREQKHEIMVLRGELDIALRKLVMLQNINTVKDANKLINLVGGKYAARDRHGT